MSEHTPLTTLNDDERLSISAVVHQNYYMPDVFSAVERILARRVRPLAVPPAGPIEQIILQALANARDKTYRDSDPEHAARVAELVLREVAPRRDLTEQETQAVLRGRADRVAVDAPEGGEGR